MVEGFKAANSFYLFRGLRLTFATAPDILSVLVLAALGTRQVQLIERSH
jgi:hypothetical protein